MNLAQYLTQRSREICADNDCMEDEHHCESYAYITKGGTLLDICACDYFQGASAPIAAIPLPWNGTQDALEGEIANQTEDDY